MEIIPADENADFYSIGAAIALSVAILGAISNILTAKVSYLAIVTLEVNYISLFLSTAMFVKNNFVSFKMETVGK